MDETGAVFTVEEAAGLLRIHPETVRREIKAGRMPACRIGRDYRISRADLEGYYRAGGGGSLFPEPASFRARAGTAAPEAAPPENVRPRTAAPGTDGASCGTLTGNQHSWI